MISKKNTNIWLNGVMGVVVGDALGCPVQFESREEVSGHQVTGMRGYGTFNLPEGSWTDDSSLTLALLESISSKKGIDPDDIMNNFVKWLDDGEFTPYGYSYDIGQSTFRAITSYKSSGKWRTCGCSEEWNNGNGSLMRILPACIYCSDMLNSGEYTEQNAVEIIHAVGSLTHAHIRANIGCGLYFFMTDQILTGEGTLQDRLQAGLDRGFAFYESSRTDKAELCLYNRLKDLGAFTVTPEEQVKSSGYVIDTLEAAAWSLINTNSFSQALLKAVNLGNDTDSVAAVAGGLAGLYYGYGQIPEAWLSAIKRREWIEEMCRVSNIIQRRYCPFFPMKVPQPGRLTT